MSGLRRETARIPFQPSREQFQLCSVTAGFDVFAKAFSLAGAIRVDGPDGLLKVFGCQLWQGV